MLLVLVLGGAVVWLALGGDDEAPRARAVDEVEAPAKQPAPVKAASLPKTVAEPELEPVRQPSPPAEQATVVPAAQDDFNPKPGDHPHPITPERRRIYHENDMVATIDNAIQVKDYQAVRRFNDEYRRQYPADEFNMQDAYDMIADCMEEKTPERVARAREFWETRRSSRARRDLRKNCLE